MSRTSTSGAITRLTKAENEHIVNGTSDWVYEEELDLRDGFRWSPDGRRIAYWQFDTTGDRDFTLINDTDTLYPTLTRIPYPKAGTTNSAVARRRRRGRGRSDDLAGDARRSAQHLHRRGWSGRRTARSLAVQQLNRLQNRNDVLIADARTGAVRRAHRDESKAWVDVTDDFTWLDGGRAFLWVSERDGWRHLYRVATDGSGDRLVTKFDGDVIAVSARRRRRRGGCISSRRRRRRPSSTCIARGSTAARTPERVTPEGTARLPHLQRVARSAAGRFTPTRGSTCRRSTELVSLPDHRVVRTLVDNAALTGKLAALGNRADRVLHGRRRRRRHARRLDDEAADVRPVAQVSAARFRLRRAGQPDGARPMGRQPRAVPSGARERRLHRRERGQPRHAGAERRGLAQGRLRHDRRPLVAGTGGGGARADRAACVHRSGARRDLGLERRRDRAR